MVTFKRASNAWREFVENANRVRWWRSRLLHRVVGPLYETVRKEPPSITDLDWDNLIILDACRYDVFKEVYSESKISGDLSKRQSQGSATPDFLKKNFGDDRFYDTVYVSANVLPSIYLSNKQFHDFIPVWKYGWDDNLRTVTPEKLQEYAIQTSEKYHNKRLIVHFLQPHSPYIGEYRLNTVDTGHDRERRDFLDNSTDDKKDKKNTPPFELLRTGQLSKNEHWKAYKSNLECAIPAVRELLEALPGRTAVTADHGEGFGEFAFPFPIRVYAHPIGVPVPVLTEVPWLVSDSQQRKNITSELPSHSSKESIVDEKVQQRLRDLGYTDTGETIYK